MVLFRGEHSATALSKHGAQKMCQLHNACVMFHVACALGRKSCCVTDWESQSLGILRLCSSSLEAWLDKSTCALPLLSFSSSTLKRHILEVCHADCYSFVRLPQACDRSPIIIMVCGFAFGACPWLSRIIQCQDFSAVRLPATSDYLDFTCFVLV